MKTERIVLLLFGVAFTSCQTTNPPVTTPNAAQNRNLAVRNTRDSLHSQITQIVSVAKGRVGVSAMLLETGETLFSLNPQEHFPMQSVYKLPITMAVMKRVDDGKLSLEQKERITKDDYVGRAAHSPIRDKYPQGAELTVNELLRYTLSESDGTASDVLMKLSGGGAAVQGYVTSLQINDLKVLNTEKEFSQDSTLQFRNYASPESAIAVLRALFERRGLSESSQAVLLQFMIASRPGAKRLKGELPAGTIVAHKTGTSGTQNGITAATNDIGIITLPNGKHLAIAVFVSDSPADEATRERVIAKVAKAIYDDAVNQ